MYLVDTSVWVDFLRGKSTQRSQLLNALLEDGDAYLCEITFAEICFGAKGHPQFQKYFNYFSELPFLALPQNWHRLVAKLGHRLKSKGYRPFMADLMIALTALTHHCPLLTEDSDFKPYQQLFELELA